jgi:hypothetical protein
MKRLSSLMTSLEKLEKVLQPAKQAYVVWGSCPIPDDPITDETIERWLRDGLASAGSYGLEHVIHYHGAERELTPERWVEKYAQAQ